MHRDEGSILKTYPLGEYGVIVAWCTREHGIIRTAARNARKAGSDFFGLIDLFYECELLFAPPSNKSGGDLYTLKSVSLLKPRLNLRRDLLRLRLASYMVRLLMATVESGAAQEQQWHDLLSRALDYLNESSARRAVLERFEQRMAVLHGLYAPENPHAVPPHAALLRHFQHLPDGRSDLLSCLP